MAEHASFQVGSQYASEAVDRVNRAINSRGPRNIEVTDVRQEGSGRYLVYAKSPSGITHTCKVVVEVIDNAGQRSCDVIVHDDDYGPGRDGKCGRMVTSNRLPER